MTEIYVLIAITFSGYFALAYLGTGIVLKEFKGISLPLIKRVYNETSSNWKSRQIKMGRWMDFRGNRVCSSCKTVFNDEAWAMLGNRIEYCPKCGSYNEIC